MSSAQQTVASTPLDLVEVDCPACGSKDATDIATGLDFEYSTSPDVFHIVGCTACGVARLNPRPAVSELGRIYPPEYAPHQFETSLSWFTLQARKLFLRGRVTSVRRLVGDTASILEVGCGDGQLIGLLRAYGAPGWRLAGNDMNDSAAARLSKLGIPFYPGRFEDLMVDSGAWDLILMKDVIEHLDNPEAILRKALSMLRPGGFLVMETPNLLGWDARMVRRRYWGGWHFPRHWTIYTPESIATHARRVGFEVSAIEPTLSPNFWAQSVHHWLIERGPRWRRLAPWFDARNALVMGVFSMLDLVQMRLHGQTSNMRVVVRAARP